jgi:hypothetical protein
MLQKKGNDPEESQTPDSTDIFDKETIEVVDMAMKKMKSSPLRVKPMLEVIMKRQNLLIW